MAASSYASLNFKWNPPYGVLTRAEKQLLTVPRLDLMPFVERLHKLGYALQLLQRFHSDRAVLHYLYDRVEILTQGNMSGIVKEGEWMK